MLDDFSYDSLKKVGLGIDMPPWSIFAVGFLRGSLKLPTTGVDDFYTEPLVKSLLLGLSASADTVIGTSLKNALRLLFWLFLLLTLLEAPS